MKSLINVYNFQLYSDHLFIISGFFGFSKKVRLYPVPLYLIQNEQIL